ncbi:hypothetical protein Csa_023119 [Cucumis sativus]|uniref:Uncharacterized protein n=1 Tax=Cucumis sativus TaxID=3659 RepID=A0A0A0KMM8_CUCSA|nr:hypothetical protein Csa_023119 [Cucumis sativus]
MAALREERQIGVVTNHLIPIYMARRSMETVTLTEPEAKTRTRGSCARTGRDARCSACVIRMMEGFASDEREWLG